MNKRSTDSESPASPKRRDLLTAGSAGAFATMLTGSAALSQETSGRGGGSSDLNIKSDYDTVPLRKDRLRVTAVQSIMRAVRNTKKPEKEMKANVDHMIELIDMANGFAGPQDLVCFHEQPIMGWNPWTREEVLRVAIEVPGPETVALGKKS